MSRAEGQLPPRIHAPLPGARSLGFVERMAQAECPALTARRARRREQSGAAHDPIVWQRALGSNVWDVDGNRFVDLSAGFGAAALGHTHPELRAALAAQSARLLHALGDLQPSDAKVALCERLAGLAPFDDARVMLGLSGSDAVTAALKTAMLATGRPGVLAFEGGYHGLAYGPLATCGYSSAFRAPFAAQENPHVRFAPFPQSAGELASALGRVRAALDGEVGAVVVEPLQGRGGVHVPPSAFLAELSALCRARGALLIVDEIMTGLGRVGATLASAREGVEPDLICLGKGLGGGVPVSACLGRGRVMAAWGDPGGEAIHTGTFFGNPLSCVAALTTLDVLERDRLPQRAQQLGARFAAQLAERLGGRARVRGLGLLVGIELASGAHALAAIRALLERGYITVPAGADARVISLTPPLTIDESLLEGFVDELGRLSETWP